MNQYPSTSRVFRRGPVVPAPFRTAMAHVPTFFAKLTMEVWIALGRSVPVELKSLATLRAGSLIGCPW